jgi:hypothetical protein
MKSFKEFVLNEGLIENLIKKYGPDKEKILNDPDFKLKINGVDNSSPLLRQLDKKIAEASSTSNQKEEKNYEKGSLANDVAKGNYDTAKSKMDWILKNEKDKVTVNVKNAFKDLSASLKEVPKAASVVTEDLITENNHRKKRSRQNLPAVSGSNALAVKPKDAPAETEETGTEQKAIEAAIAAAERADEALKTAGINIGDNYNNGTDGQRAEIIEEFIGFINKLCQGNDFISSDGGGAIIKRLKQAARDNKLTILETRDFISSSNDILKKPTNLNFIIALLWLKTVVPELYKDALMTSGGSAKANQGINEAVREQYAKIIGSLGDLTLDKDYLKKLGETLESFSVNSFKGKIFDLTKELTKKLSPEEAEKVKKMQGRLEQPERAALPGNSETTNTPSTSETPNVPSATNTSGTPSENNSNNASAEEESEQEDNTSNENAKNTSLASLTVNSTPEEVQKAVADAFGVRDGDKINSSLLNNFYKACDRVQTEKSKEAANSNERKLANSKPVEEQAEELLNMILEGRGNRLRLRQDAQATQAGWDDAKDNLTQIASKYLKQASNEAANYKETTPSKEREKILIKLRALFNNMSYALTKAFHKAKKSNSYGELGSILYNSRINKDTREQEKEAKYKDSEKGRREAQIEEFTDKKLSEVINAIPKINKNGESGDILAKTNSKVFGYAILHPDSIKGVAKAGWNSDSKKTIGEISLETLSNAGIKGITIDALPSLLSKLSQQKDILPVVQKWAADYEDGVQYANIQDDKEIYNKFSSKAIAFIGKLRSLGDKLTDKILLKDDVSSMSFKDYYKIIYEDEQPQQPQQNDVGLPELSKEEKRAVAFAILATSSDEQELKTAADYLSLIGKDGTPSGYIKAIEKYKKENAQAIAQLKASIARQANASLQQPQVQPQQPAATPATQQPAPQPTPAPQPQNNQPVQATVTTAACGGFTIPERLNKKLIRRKLNPSLVNFN